MDLPIITVDIPQLDRMGYADYISIAIAIIAVAAIIGSVVISNKQNALAVRQINREERIKIYAPMLALLGMEWVQFDWEIIHSLDPAAVPPFLVSQQDIDRLRSEVRGFETEAIEKFVGSPKIHDAVDGCMTFMNECFANYRELLEEERKASAGLLPGIADFTKHRYDSLIALSAKSSVLKSKIEDLGKLASKELAL